jgi:hypothetical protein
MGITAGFFGKPYKEDRLRKFPATDEEVQLACPGIEGGFYENRNRGFLLGSRGLSVRVDPAGRSRGRDSSEQETRQAACNIKQSDRRLESPLRRLAQGEIEARYTTTGPGGKEPILCFSSFLSIFSSGF